MPEVKERKISPAVVIIPISLSLAALVGIAALAFAAPPIVYTCSYCGAEFSTEAELLAHIESEHPEAPVFSCPYCGATFATEEELLTHIEFEHPEIPPEAWLLPTGHIDPDNQWDYERAAYDGDTDTYAENWTPVETWSGPLELTTAPIAISAIRCYISSPLTPKIADIDAFYEGAWHDVYEGELSAGWNEISIPGGVKAVTKARFRMYNRSYTRRMRFRLHEFHFWGS